MAELLGRFHILLEAPAGHRHPTSKLHGQVQEALDALDVGGEGGRHDPSGRFSEDPLERADEVTFGAAVAGALSVGGVAEQQQDTLLAELAEALEVRGRTHRWVVVEDRKSTRLNSSHSQISYAVFCLKKKKKVFMYNTIH